VATLARGAVASWGARAASFLWLVLGAALLASAWSLFAGWRRLETLPERLTGRATGQVEETYWLLQGPEPPTGGPRSHDSTWSHGSTWSHYAEATLNATVAFTTAEGRSVRTAFRSPSALPLVAFTPGAEQLLTPALRLRWTDLARDLPRAEVRFAREDFARLSAARSSAPIAYRWGPDAEQPAAGSELDELWGDLDFPLELLARAWAAPPPGPVEIAYDPAEPADALPVSQLTAGRGGGQRARDLTLLAGLGGFGLLLWGVGILLLSRGVPGWLAAAVAALPLLLPVWSEGYWRVVRWVLPADAELLITGFGSFDYAQQFGLLEARPPLPGNSLERREWRFDDSRHAPLLAGFTLARPSPPPADADAAWVAIAEQLTAQALALDEDAQRELLMALMEDVRFGRQGLGLVFAEAARQMSLDPSRSANLHEWATAYLHRLLQHTSLPWPGGRGLARDAQRSMLVRLADHPDVAVRETATRQVADNDQAWAVGR
jgi:hypothetical protein